ncbi:hypothetical protein RRG08_036352 [Elysia crispata]|uniref:Uncharacterized protein n=1 Tax=Elysia crispata TaxID=231223 RepID=A0AAE0ZK08_9GAST|nr:hypothetical protein RRG08_036352 [Elysia crispata]
MLTVQETVKNSFDSVHQSETGMKKLRSESEWSGVWCTPVSRTLHSRHDAESLAYKIQEFGDENIGSRVPVGGAQPGSPHECREWLARAARGAQVLEGCSWQPFHLGPPPAARPAATSGMKGENYANVRLTPDPQKLHSFRRFAS